MALDAGSIEVFGGVRVVQRHMCIQRTRSTYFQNLSPPNVLITRKCQKFVKITNDIDAPGANAIKRKEHSFQCFFLTSNVPQFTNSKDDLYKKYVPFMLLFNLSLHSMKDSTNASKRDDCI